MSRGSEIRLPSTSAWFPESVVSAGIRENCWICCSRSAGAGRRSRLALKTASSSGLRPEQPGRDLAARSKASPSRVWRERKVSRFFWNLAAALACSSPPAGIGFRHLVEGQHGAGDGFAGVRCFRLRDQGTVNGFKVGHLVFYRGVVNEGAHVRGDDRAPQNGHDEARGAQLHFGTQSAQGRCRKWWGTSGTCSRRCPPASRRRFPWAGTWCPGSRGCPRWQRGTSCWPG